MDPLRRSTIASPGAGATARSPYYPWDRTGRSSGRWRYPRPCRPRRPEPTRPSDAGRATTHRGAHRLLRVASGGSSRVRDGPTDGMEMAQRLGVGAEQRGLAVRQALLLAEPADEGLGAAQVGSGHTREQMVLDLVVETAEHH